jgi:redox-sensitive bicupin YhaK (pirin superfamily)/Flp pilus assembly pilin Flp
MVMTSETLACRPVRQIVTAHRQREGAGFIVRRPFPTHGLDHVDPFLMLDEVGPIDYGPGEALGAPDHPHRGFETVSYILEGEKLHEDSTGFSQLLGPGDVQWMTAGSGIVHSEMPSPDMQRLGGRAHGFQIWVNLPAATKMVAPRYQHVPADEIPLGTSEDGRIEARVIAGEAFGTRAAIDTFTPIVLQDWTVRPGGRATQHLAADHQAAVYVFDGEVPSRPLSAAGRSSPGRAHRPLRPLRHERPGRDRAGDRGLPVGPHGRDHPLTASLERQEQVCAPRHSIAGPVQENETVMVQTLIRYSAGAFCVARALARDRSGAVATEYAVLVGGIAFTIIVLVFSIGVDIATIFEFIDGYLD